MSGASLDASAGRSRRARGTRSRRKRTHDRVRRSFVEATSTSPAAAAAETAATRGSSAEPTPAAPESSARGRSHGLVRGLWVLCESLRRARASREVSWETRGVRARASVCAPHARRGQALHRRFASPSGRAAVRAAGIGIRAPPGDFSQARTRSRLAARAQISARTRSARRVPTVDRPSSCHTPPVEQHRSNTRVDASPTSRAPRPIG